MVQVTDYPWSGNVAITVNPTEARRFSIRIRAANRNVSSLYTASPTCDGMASLAVNGTPVTPALSQGYAVLTREWRAGDRIDLVLPMKVQRIKASSRIAATAGRVALRYGPLIYNVESADQDVNAVLRPAAELATEWKGDLLGGVLVIKGQWADGKPLTAIPNYARLNRGGRSIVWIKDQ
jgi:DUF1680 family protein